MSGTPFDHAASTYDQDLARQSAVFLRFRRVIWQTLHRVLPPGGAVLELGCGTGEDTCFLLGTGRDVWAVDPSQAMLERTREKAAHLKVGGQLTLLRARAGNLAHHLPSDQEFSGAVSNLGPLNAEQDLNSTADMLAAALPPGAPLVLSPMAALCPWELAWYLLTLHPRRALVRLNPGFTPVPVGGGATVPTAYPLPRTFLRPFTRWFDLTSMRALGLLLPPPYLRWTRDAPQLLDLLDSAEERLAHRRILRALGDHTLYVLRRR